MSPPTRPGKAAKLPTTPPTGARGLVQVELKFFFFFFWLKSHSNAGPKGALPNAWQNVLDTLMVNFLEFVFPLIETVYWRSFGVNFKR